MEQKLLLTLLNHDFYERNKHLITADMWPRELRYIYEALQYAHEHFERDLKLAELHELILGINQALTGAQQSYLVVLFDDIAALEAHAEDLGEDLLRRWIKAEVYRKIAESCAKGMNGEAQNTTELRALLDRVDGTVSIDGPEVNFWEFEDLLAESTNLARWQFNLPTLHQRIPGLGPATLTIIGARPETGKTGLWVSLCAGPDGFLDQGAKVLAFINEEKAARTMVRCVSARTGMSLNELELNRATGKAEWDKIKHNMLCLDGSCELDDIACKAALHKPDIIVVDNADKIRTQGDFARNDLRIGHMYYTYRELGKIHDASFIAVSQTDANSEGKTKLTQKDLVDAKTAKAAEADLIMLVGKSDLIKEDFRNICIVKNKINGVHDEVGCRIQGAISRYVA